MIDDLMAEMDWQLLDFDALRQALAPTVGAWIGWALFALFAFLVLRWAAYWFIRMLTGEKL